MSSFSLCFGQPNHFLHCGLSTDVNESVFHLSEICKMFLCSLVYLSLFSRLLYTYALLFIFFFYSKNKGRKEICMFRSHHELELPQIMFLNAINFWRDYIVFDIYLHFLSLFV
jgi:hypothetical protein